ncbi:MAG: 2-oxoacid:acceptor oxidoreductase family protein [Candidatus Njordarchaeia archaeon]
MLIEVRWHGRGGQGAVTASRLLAKAAAYENIWAQSIVFFGAERRGAHVAAYTRLSDKVIKYHHFVHNPDYVVVLAPQLLDTVNVTEGLKEGGTIVLNYKEEGADKLLEEVDGKWKIAIVDATQIAIDLNLFVAGIPVVNTVMLGAFAKAAGLPSIDSVCKAIREYWPEEIAKTNIEGAKLAYEKTKMLK